MQINMKRKYDDIADSCHARESKSSPSTSSKVFPLLSALFWPEPFCLIFFWSGLTPPPLPSLRPSSSFLPVTLVSFLPGFSPPLFFWLLLLFPLPFTLLSTSPLWTLLSVCPPPPFPPFPPSLPSPPLPPAVFTAPRSSGPLWLSSLASRNVLRV